MLFAFWFFLGSRHDDASLGKVTQSGEANVVESAVADGNNLTPGRLTQNGLLLCMLFGLWHQSVFLRYYPDYDQFSTLLSLKSYERIQHSLIDNIWYSPCRDCEI